MREEHPVTTIDAAPDLQAERIGGRIRSLRHARGYTLVQLAESAELSHPFLSQLERGLARPSIASLEKIARALGSSQIELLAAADDEATPELQEARVVLVRSDEGSRGRYSEAEARMLVHGRRAFHPMEITGSNREFGDTFEHQEDEFLYVLRGRVVVDLGEEGIHELRSGDAMYFAGGTVHRWRAPDGNGYRLLVVKEHPARL